VLILAWTVYLLLFAVEVVALVAIGGYVWSASDGGTGRRIAATAAAVVVTIVVWGVFASPDNPVGNVWITAVVKVSAFGAAAAAVWATTGRRWAVPFIAAAVLINALAMVPAIRDAVG
jgi:hypothetical protein